MIKDFQPPCIKYAYGSRTASSPLVVI